MNVDNHLIKNLPCFKDITYISFTCGEIMKNIQEWKIMVGEVLQGTLQFLAKVFTNVAWFSFKKKPLIQILES
jgi:hypothetical protein